MSIDENSTSVRVDTEDPAEMFHSVDGFEYCVDTDDLADVVPEESISDDESEGTRSLQLSCSMDLGKDVIEEESKHGQCLYMCEEGGLDPQVRTSLYHDPHWRLRHWDDLCNVAFSTNWYKTDAKDGITISRSKFGRGRANHAVIKVEGYLNHYPETILQFLQLTMKPGGKLDYLFRNETLLDQVQGEDWPIDVIYNTFQVPLPKVATRDVVAMKVWVTESDTNHTGFVMFSVDHPSARPPDHDITRIHVNPSGCILTHHPDKGNDMQTKVTILVQVLLGGGLHRMMKGAYNSGLLKLGLRSSFQHVRDQFSKFQAMTNI
jgi:hypothetical protein